MKKLLSFIFVAIAAVLNAVLDTLKDHFSVSVFKNLNPKFWNPQVSYATSITLFGVHWDAWHIIKYAFIASIFMAIVMFEQVFKWWVEFIMFFLLWWIFFELFYTYIFK